MVDNQNGSSKTANSRDLYVVASSPELPRGGRIDCGPKLANLRRYWRDYYVVDNNKTLPSSSTMTSVDNKVIINKAKIELVQKDFHFIHYQKLATVSNNTIRNL